ncbi:hypothetical protein G8761_09235 [Bacillus sp. C11]|nr:hypothetical protein [Neobacillus terrae]
MPSLIENLKESLKETKNRLELINEHGNNALNVIYHHGFPQIRGNIQEFLPKEIQGLELRIRQ